MNVKQGILRFSHPGGVRTSSQWRQAFKAAKELNGIDLDAFGLTQSSTALSFTARTPLASSQLDERVMDFMRATANIAGRPLDVQKLDLSPKIDQTNHRWSYLVPKWIVAKPAKSKAQQALWTEWRKDEAPVSLQEKMMADLNESLTDQIQTWLGHCPALHLAIESFGAPMVISGAIANSGTPVSALARLNVQFSSSERIEGAFFAGALNVTGFGRIFRNGYLEKIA